MKNMWKIKDIVKDNMVYFIFYRHQHMYYGIDFGDEKRMFPVPLEDVEDASLHAEEKAIMYMRYIRKAIDTGQFVPQSFTAVLRSQALPT